MLFLQGPTSPAALRSRIISLVLVAVTFVGGWYVRAGAAAAGETAPPAPTTQSQSLEPHLARQLDLAIAAAARAGVTINVTSGRRSWAEQERMYQDAIKKYGSPEAASRWVLPPDRSEHVRGAAVDVGPRSGAKWLERHGQAFGLCRRYDNEWWHFELLAPNPGDTCPAREHDANG